MATAAPSSAPRYAQAALHRGLSPIPSTDSLQQLRESARHCDSCPHACLATQTVFGHGPETAKIMIVGEQPGDIEDLHGRPFVGPSGKLLRSILVELSVEDDAIYFTNAVKHFKYTVRGKRRLHQRPTVGDIDHCRPWLSAEISLIKPKVIITMGSTATRSLFGRTVPLEEHRGRLQSFDVSASVMVTHHPAMMLRASNPDDRRRLNGQLVEDLRTALSDVMRNDEA